VTILGVVDQPRVADWLAAADVFALGTEREGCCNAVLEALAVGTPVVTTPVGDNGVFVRDGANGFIVPVDDVDALAHGLERALRHGQWDRVSISKDLLAQVGSWADVAAQVLGFFRSRLARTVSAAR
jgi:glycosyltransferase involved in cell wall biosynthesis